MNKILEKNESFLETKNLQRIFGYKCPYHGRVHKYSYGQIVSNGGRDRFYGFDTIKEISEFCEEYDARMEREISYGGNKNNYVRKI